MLRMRGSTHEQYTKPAKGRHGVKKRNKYRDAVAGFGALAQLGERLICIQEVSGSIPLGSTKSLCRAK